jgi:hypothetical protein
VHVFEAVINGRRLVGVCTPKEKAQNEYDDAIASGHKAMLLEQQAGNVDMSVYDVTGFTWTGRL